MTGGRMRRLESVIGGKIRLVRINTRRIECCRHVLRRWDTRSSPTVKTRKSIRLMFLCPQTKNWISVSTTFSQSTWKRSTKMKCKGKSSKKWKVTLIDKLLLHVTKLLRKSWLFSTKIMSIILLMQKRWGYIQQNKYKTRETHLWLLRTRTSSWRLFHLILSTEAFISRVTKRQVRILLIVLLPNHTKSNSQYNNQAIRSSQNKDPRILEHVHSLWNKLHKETPDHPSQPKDHFLKERTWYWPKKDESSIKRWKVKNICNQIIRRLKMEWITF